MISVVLSKPALDKRTTRDRRTRQTDGGGKAKLTSISTLTTFTSNLNWYLDGIMRLPLIKGRFFFFFYNVRCFKSSQYIKHAAHSCTCKVNIIKGPQSNFFMCMLCQLTWRLQLTVGRTNALLSCLLEE